MKTKSTSQTPRTLTRNASLLAITALALVTSPGSRAAGDCLCLGYWDHAGTGDWFNPLNWGPYHNAVPDCGVSCGYPWEVDINNGGTAQINTGTARACETFLGKDTRQQSGNLSVNNGTLNQCGDMWVGYAGKGTLSITNGGVVNTQFGAHIAANTGSSGSATVDGTNSKWTVTVDGAALNVGGTNTGAGGTGLLTVKNSGTVTAASVHAWKSGTLTGNGTVSTTSGTTIDGTLAPTGTLTISGDLNFGPGGTMRCNVTSSSWDRAEVSGTATLDGKLSVTLTGLFTGDFPLLHASGLTGQFSSFSATYTGCLAPSVVYDYVNGYVYLHVESTCQ
jgi:T5SS/PEP-CTERM-associated repeat protein